MITSKTVSTPGLIIIRIALGFFFLVSGISTLQGGTGDEATAAIRHLVNGDLSHILCVVFGLVELLAGILLLLKFFLDTSSLLDTVLMVIITVVWIIAIILIDILGHGGLMNGFGGNLLSYLKIVSGHLLVLGSIFIVYC